MTIHTRVVLSRDGRYVSLKTERIAPILTSILTHRFHMLRSGMGKEGPPLQHDMFSGELVDTRTRAQRSRDRANDQLQQMTMFSTRETVQYGMSARPWLKDMPQPTLTLEIQDMRTDEEKEREQRRIAEALTTPMFAGLDSGNAEVQSSDQSPPAESVTQIVYQAPNLRQVGFRAYARRTSIPVRWKGGSGSHTTG